MECIENGPPGHSHKVIFGWRDPFGTFKLSSGPVVGPKLNTLWGCIGSQSGRLYCQIHKIETEQPPGCLGWFDWFQIQTIKVFNYKCWLFFLGLSEPYLVFGVQVRITVNLKVE